MRSLTKPQQGAAALLLASSVAVVALFWVSRRRRKRNYTTTLLNVSDDELVQLFQQATEESRELLTNLAHGDKLLLYGLYKQATIGDMDPHLHKEPSKFNVMAHAKYEGWLKFQGMSCPQAMQSYIAVVNEFSSGKDMEYETEELEMFNAMGVRPSTLSGKEEDEKEYSTALTPLQKAARNGNLEDLMEALENEDSSDDTATTVNAVDESGQTALHFAADRGYCDICEQLLKAGANPNAADLEGISVLLAAVIAGHADVACLLLKSGANPNQADMDGDTPLSCARDDGSEEMKQLFPISSESSLLQVGTDDSMEHEA